MYSSFDCKQSLNTFTHYGATFSSLIAQRPIARIDLKSKREKTFSPLKQKRIEWYLLSDFNVDFLRVFLKLRKNLVNVIVGSQSNQDLDLHRLDVHRVVEETEEVTQLLFNDDRTLLENQIDVFECNEHDFRLLVEQRNQRIREFLRVIDDHFWVS